LVVKKLEAIGKQDSRIQRIQTIPGVGPRTAEILVACLDDPHRFKNGRQVSAYFGLVPRQFQSGETDRNGRITKRGNPLARTILVESAWASLRYNSWAKAVYERICGKQKTRKKKAAIALARKLAVLAWAMLRDQTDWKPSHMLKVTKSFSKTTNSIQDVLDAMKPKENSDQRKKRLRKEAREAKQAHPSTETDKATAVAKKVTKKSTSKEGPYKPQIEKHLESKDSMRNKSATTHKPRRAREPAAAV
jgi:hypothetical protein